MLDFIYENVLGIGSLIAGLTALHGYQSPIVLTSDKRYDITDSIRFFTFTILLLEVLLVIYILKGPLAEHRDYIVAVQLGALAYGMVITFKKSPYIFKHLWVCFIIRAALTTYYLALAVFLMFQMVFAPSVTG